MLKTIIETKKSNIGALCLYIANHNDLLQELDLFITNRLNYPITFLTLSQKIHIYNNKDFDIFCDCGKIKKWKSFKYGWTKTCGNKECIKNHTIKTNLINFGVINPMMNIDIKLKSQQTTYEKFGVTSAAKNKEIKNKISFKLNNRTEDEKLKTYNKRKKNWDNKSDIEKKEIKEKRKNSNNNKSDIEKNEIIENRKKTCLKKYNTEYVISSPIIREKITNTFNEKFGGNSPFSNSHIKDKAKNTYINNKIKYIEDNIKNHQCKYISHIDKGNSNIEYTLLCERTNKTFLIGYSNLRIRILSNMEISPYFRPMYGKSEMEYNILKYIKNNDNINDIIANSKKIISPLELDIYIPDLKLAFEFNGIWWHNETNKSNDYHLNKTELCEQQGIQLIHIYEDDWIHKQDIVKSMILNKIGKTENRLFARNAEVREITDNKLVRTFLESNHIQGFVASQIKIGLFYKNELVSLMTFGNRKITMGKNTEYELLRFCNVLNTNVVGGASKLFKYFIKIYNPTQITTYADRSNSQGKLYKTLGFSFVSKTKPNYYYTIDGLRHNKFNYRKSLLVKQGFDSNKTEHEIMLNRKIYRIYDSGNLKFIYNNKIS
jgi:hypothetical protein